MQKNLIPVRLFSLAIPISCPVVCKFHEVRKPVFSCHLFDKLLGFFIVHSFAGHIQRLLSFFATMPATCPVRVSSLYFCVALFAMRDFCRNVLIPVRAFFYFFFPLRQLPIEHNCVQCGAILERIITDFRQALWNYHR